MRSCRIINHQGLTIHLYVYLESLTLSLLIGEMKDASRNHFTQKLKLLGVLTVQLKLI